MQRTIFEVHITIDISEPTHEDEERFRQVCTMSMMKPIVVGVWYEYSGLGFQKFFQTSRYVSGTLQDAIRVKNECVDFVQAAGFRVRRRKIEAIASTWAPVEVDTHAKDIFYETHVVIRLKSLYLTDGSFTPSNELSVVRDLNHLCNQNLVSRKCFVPLSFNLKHSEQCFITLRCYGTRQESLDYENSCKTTIESLGFEIIKCIREVTLEDDNTAVDSEVL